MENNFVWTVTELNALFNIHSGFYKNKKLWFFFLRIFSAFDRFMNYNMTQGHFTQVAQGDFMTFSPAKVVWGGYRNGLVLHSWPRELRYVLQLWHTHLYNESVDPYQLSLSMSFLRFQLETWYVYSIDCTIYQVPISLEMGHCDLLCIHSLSTSN